MDITKAFTDLFLNINPDVHLLEQKLGDNSIYSLGLAMTEDGKYLFQGIMGEGIKFY